MTAGPYPTKAMHEQLKTRVGVLEDGGGAAPEAALTWRGQGAAQSAASERASSLVLTWARRSVLATGITLSGDVEIELIGIYRAPNQGAELLYLAAALEREVTGTGLRARTTYRWPTPLLLTEARLNINLNPSPALVTTAGAPASVPAATTLLLRDENSAPLSTGLAEVTVLGLPVPGVPGVPVPSDPTTPPLGNGPVPPRGLELVWPEAGEPYLHALVYASADGGGSSSHLPFMPGLPQ